MAGPSRWHDGFSVPPTRREGKLDPHQLRDGQSVLNSDTARMDHLTRFAAELFGTFTLCAIAMLAMAGVALLQRLTSPLRRWVDAITGPAANGA